MVSTFDMVMTYMMVKQMQDAQAQQRKMQEESARLQRETEASQASAEQSQNKSRAEQATTYKKSDNNANKANLSGGVLRRLTTKSQQLGTGGAVGTNGALGNDKDEDKLF